MRCAWRTLAQRRQQLHYVGADLGIRRGPRQVIFSQLPSLLQVAELNMRSLALTAANVAEKLAYGTL